MKKIIVFLFFFYSIQQSNAQTYRNLFDKLDISFQTLPHSFQTQLNGTLLGSAIIMPSYLNMYEAIKDKKYLDKFIIHAKRIQDVSINLATKN